MDKKSIGYLYHPYSPMVFLFSLRSRQVLKTVKFLPSTTIVLSWIDFIQISLIFTDILVLFSLRFQSGQLLPIIVAICFNGLSQTYFIDNLNATRQLDLYFLVIALWVNTCSKSTIKTQSRTQGR